MRRLTLIFRPVLLLMGCLLSAGVLTGCAAGTVQVPVPSPDPAAARLCAGLRPPHRLHGQTERTTSPRSRLVAAWGSPAIALRCGVSRPAALRPASQLVTVNGISWFEEPADRPVTFTAVGRQAYVEVTIPAKYTEHSPPGDVLLELTAAIKAALPEKADGEL
ncbi:DUF3515 domain-containing protein [Actinomadura scrupuli]|uniref:DUF3515 domain-containing protein n=1 Tax=Actinomadura scrupuli TaxID=559629 RepID=UPI003D995288